MNTTRQHNALGEMLPNEYRRYYETKTNILSQSYNLVCPKMGLLTCLKINKIQDKKMNNSEILIYQNSEGSIKIDVRLEEESVWLNQTQMAELF